MVELPQKPAPPVNRDSDEYFGFAGSGALMLRLCHSCGNLMYYPRILCTRCMSIDLGWQQACGRGRVYAVSVIYRAPTPAFRDEVPYALAVIELEEGVRVMSNVTNCLPESVFIDMPVELEFETRGEGIAIPQFRPLANSSGGSL